MPTPPTLPDQASDQALAHVPTQIPPAPPVDVTLPDVAVENIIEHVPLVGLNHIPDWLLG